MNNNTINKIEIEKFSKLAKDWWDPDGKFKPLHKFNPVRIKYIKEYLKNHYNIKKKIKPLSDIEILDIGCGGGLLSEPLSNLGANVIGIDASKKNIEAAKLHSKENNLNIKYFCNSPENFKINKKFDVVLNMEIVEHVHDLNLFIKKSSNFLKKNGVMFVATINKTLKSYVFAIIGAEYILKWLPIGTHDWDKFVKPDKLLNVCKKNQLIKIKTDGVKFNPIIDEWKISHDESVNYISVFKKN